MPWALEARHLSKSYKRNIKRPGLLGAFAGVFSARSVEIPAVRDLSFSIRQGEAVGLIGENGAGKSTTVKMLTGILRPSGGEILALGLTPHSQREKLAASIGVVFGQKPQLLWDIPVRETFELLKAMYGVPEDVYRLTSQKSLELLDLRSLLDVPVRQLSLGQRMRCDLAAAFLHAPRIAFLDEPTIGLDVVAKEQARELIRFNNRHFGTTVLLTTHDVKDITETCKRVILLDKGGLLFDGSLAAFERRFASERRLLVDFERPLSPRARKSLAALAGRSGGRLIKAEASRVQIAYTKKSALLKLGRALLAMPGVADMNLERVEVEEIVRRIYMKRAHG